MRSEDPCWNQGAFWDYRLIKGCKKTGVHMGGQIDKKRPERKREKRGDRQRETEKRNLGVVRSWWLSLAR